MTAVRSMLDEEYNQLPNKHVHDSNNYVLGRIHEHNVVIACLPSGVYGTTAAARVADNMLRTFVGLRFGLLVGIGGGIPDVKAGRDVRLGDVVVSQPDQTFGGVVQYDMGKNHGTDNFVRTGALDSPPERLLTALANLRSASSLNVQAQKTYATFVTEAYEKHPGLRDDGYTSPGPDTDHLHCARCRTETWWWLLWLLLVWVCPFLQCDLCDSGRVRRPLRTGSKIHYGTIASGNQVIKDSFQRDKLGRDYNALCVEMEAAGLMNKFRCLVIRGICDYADHCKNDAWQKYAALVAAAFAKDFLQHVTPEQTDQLQRILDVGGILQDQLGVQQEILADTRQQRRDVQMRLLDDKQRKCHQTFKTCSYEEFKDENPLRAEGTCQWVLQHPVYNEWQRCDGDALLWISADPGCDNEEQDHVATALCAILHQLFTQQPNIIRHAMKPWGKHGDSLPREKSELWRILLAAATDEDAQSVTCVLDALDECRPGDRGEFLKRLVEFHAVAKKSAPAGSRRRHGQAKFLVTSRPYDDIEDGFHHLLQTFPTIRLRGEDENDQIRHEINLVIEERMLSDPKILRLPEKLRECLRERLLDTENRTYLWLHLAIKSIPETLLNSFQPEKEPFDFLPSTVDDAYEKILSRIDESNEDKARRILQIVVGSRRPLKVSEMAIALGLSVSGHEPDMVRLEDVRLDVNHTHERLRQWCGLFLYVHHDRILFIHQTAKEFLVADRISSKAPTGWKRCLDTVETEGEMARICIHYLHMEEILPVARDLTQQVFRSERTSVNLSARIHEMNPIESFILYAAQYWPSHKRAGPYDLGDATTSWLQELYSDNMQRHWLQVFWNTWGRGLGSLGRSSDTLTRLQLAAFLGDEQTLCNTLKTAQAADLLYRGKFNATALDKACQEGQDKAVERLMDRSSDITDVEYYRSAIFTAIERGHHTPVEIMLRKGVDPNSLSSIFEQLLTRASEKGFEGIVELLLRNGADSGGRGNTALFLASENGHRKIVERLLKSGADVNTNQGFSSSRTALYVASKAGHVDIVKVLLKNGADPNGHPKKYRFKVIALQVVSESGCKETTKVSLDADADINAVSDTALQAAAKRGDKETVEMLLDAGADVNAQGGRCGNALQTAAEENNDEIVRILLKSGANINARGGQYETALQAACYSSTPLSGGRGAEKSRAVDLLLDAGADVNIEGGYYGSPLRAAFHGYRIRTMITLIKHGARYKAQVAPYAYAIEVALVFGRHGVVETLLSANAAPNGNCYHDRAFQEAMEKGYTDAVRLSSCDSLRRRMYQEILNSRYPLFTAIRLWHETAVKMLRSRGADAELKGVLGETLDMAKREGLREIIDMLLEGRLPGWAHQ
ncbi:purine and uridine phosphorylase [Hortaea werneckii]|nr:purine and uridine phosphorylase [Hortaea werneckii]KAI7619462.1 purine and uridine phosphorylase [Hortaea werneckii]KAI7632570.1 purine and uridine phosphorylase [Hortaea werneckii]KAI7678595.1 purine and uridine phosphorylase [Hortaea werneckii]KAI7709684.1 purine and uridine phosphorylase [Hortaea werneckii]